MFFKSTVSQSVSKYPNQANARQTYGESETKGTHSEFGADEILVASSRPNEAWSPWYHEARSGPCKDARLEEPLSVVCRGSGTVTVLLPIRSTEESEPDCPWPDTKLMDDLA